MSQYRTIDSEYAPVQPRELKNPDVTQVSNNNGASTSTSSGSTTSTTEQHLGTLSPSDEISKSQEEKQLSDTTHKNNAFVDPNELRLRDIIKLQSHDDSRSATIGNGIRSLYHLLNSAAQMAIAYNDGPIARYGDKDPIIESNNKQLSDARASLLRAEEALKSDIEKNRNAYYAGSASINDRYNRLRPTIGTTSQSHDSSSSQQQSSSGISESKESPTKKANDLARAIAVDNNKTRNEEYKERKNVITPIDVNNQSFGNSMRISKEHKTDLVKSLASVINDTNNTLTINGEKKTLKDLFIEKCPGSRTTQSINADMLGIDGKNGEVVSNVDGIDYDQLLHSPYLMAHPLLRRKFFEALAYEEGIDSSAGQRQYYYNMFGIKDPNKESDTVRLLDEFTPVVFPDGNGSDFISQWKYYLTNDGKFLGGGSKGKVTTANGSSSSEDEYSSL